MSQNKRQAMSDTESTSKPAGFSQFARATAKACGHPMAFKLATGTVILWLVTGPLFGFSNTWQLVINTGTTIVTFLMVFLIQNTQNRDAEAMQVKLDELIRALDGASNSIIDSEDLEDDQLANIRARFHRLGADARAGKDEPPTPAR